MSLFRPFKHRGFAQPSKENFYKGDHFGDSASLVGEQQSGVHDVECRIGAQLPRPVAARRKVGRRNLLFAGNAIFIASACVLSLA